MCVCVSTQWCLTLCNPMDQHPPGSSVHGTFQARILEWVAIYFSRGSSLLRHWIQVSCIFCIGGGFFNSWVTTEAPRKLVYKGYSQSSLEHSIFHLNKTDLPQKESILWIEQWVHLEGGHMKWPSKDQTCILLTSIFFTAGKWGMMFYSLNIQLF